MELNRLLRPNRSQLLTAAFIFFFLTGYLFAQLPQPDHVVIVVEENHSYEQIIGNDDAPYINALAADDHAALFTDAHGVSHPSQPNYLYLFSGDNQGVTNDTTPSGLPFTTANLGAQLIQSGYTFKGYSEGLPAGGYDGAFSGKYARKHNPWVYWQNADSNRIPPTLNLPYKDFPADYNQLPTICFVIPNQNNDMHDGSIAMGDTWLHDHLDGYIQWAKTHNSLFILTFDEDDHTTVNHVVTIFVGPMVKNGSYNKTINHLNVLRTLEDMYGLGYAGNASDVSPISDIWVDTSKAINTNSVSHSFYLAQNYPNPFNPNTVIGYQLPVSGKVTLVLYDVLGREIEILVDKNQSAGTYSITFGARDLPAGVYFYKLQAGGFSEVKQMLLVK